MRTALLALVLSTPFISGCAALAIGAGIGIVATQDTIDSSVYVATVPKDASLTWASVKTTLSHTSLQPVDVDNETKKAVADVDGAKVTVTVETYDLNKSVVRTSAKKFGVKNGDIAKMVNDKIITDLEK